jgi:hypothetical protein
MLMISRGKNQTGFSAATMLVKVRLGWKKTEKTHSPWTGLREDCGSRVDSAIAPSSRFIYEMCLFCENLVPNFTSNTTNRISGQLLFEEMGIGGKNIGRDKICSGQTPVLSTIPYLGSRAIPLYLCL